MRRKDREISRIEIDDIIKKSDVCRLAFADQNTPYIVTLNYGYEEYPEALFFHCASEGRKLDMLRKNNYVCFEMDIDHELHTGDKGCSCGTKYRSVVGYGRISEIEDHNEKIKGLNCIMKHYSEKTSFDFEPEMVRKTTVLKLEITGMTGKKC